MRFGLLHNGKPLLKRLVFQCSPLTFSKKQISTAQGKALNRSDKFTKWSPIVISTVSAPFTPHFRPFCTLDWLVSSPVQTRLTENWLITKVVRPPSQWKTNIKKPGISVLTSYLCLFIYLFLINLMYLLVLFMMKINNDSKDQNNCVMKCVSCGFHSIK